MLTNLESMLKRERLGAGYANRIIYTIYKNRQRRRFQTENLSEGEKWKALNPKYAERKLIKYADYNGKGQNIMFATGRLRSAVTGDDGIREHRKIVLEGKKLQVSWTTPYAEYTEEVRPVNEWSIEKDLEMYQGFITYIITGKEQRTDY